MLLTFWSLVSSSEASHQLLKSLRVPHKYERFGNKVNLFACFVQHPQFNIFMLFQSSSIIFLFSNEKQKNVYGIHKQKNRFFFKDSCRINSEYSWNFFISIKVIVKSKPHLFEQRFDNKYAIFTLNTLCHIWINTCKNSKYLQISTVIHLHYYLV